jgi:hypothetical protein
VQQQKMELFCADKVIAIVGRIKLYFKILLNKSATNYAIMIFDNWDSSRRRTALNTEKGAGLEQQFMFLEY